MPDSIYPKKHPAEGLHSEIMITMATLIYWLPTAMERPQLLRNDDGNQNNWVKVQIRGTTSNRAGIGARVEVVTGHDFTDG